MIGLKVRTNTRERHDNHGSEEELKSNNDFAIPTLESIITQIQNEIPELKKEEAEGLAGKVYSQFKKIEKNEFSKLFGPTKPALQIQKWRSPWMMYDRMRYSADYSHLTMLPKCQFGGIDFHPVIVHATKCIMVHYVEP